MVLRGNTWAYMAIHGNAWVYLVHKSLSAAGISEDNAQGWKLRGQLWNFENNLSAVGIILRYSSKPERGLFIS